MSSKDYVKIGYGLDLDLLFILYKSCDLFSEESKLFRQK